MSNAWKIVMAIIAFVILTAVGYWSYKQYRTIKGPHISAIEAIDQDVVFFLQSKDIRSSLYKLTSETRYWEQFQNQEPYAGFQNRFQYLDSIISSHAGINEIFELYEFTLAWEENQNGEYDFIYLSELPTGDLNQTLESFIKKTSGPQSIILRKEYQNALIITVNLSGPEALFYYTVYKGLFVGSFDENLLLKTIDHLGSKNSITRDDAFMRIHSTAGKNVDANIFVNIPNFMRWISRYFKASQREMLDKLQDFGHWCEVDLLINENDLLLNGYTITSDSSGKLLNRFRSKPQAVRATEVLPHNVEWLIHWGIADMVSYLNQAINPDELNASIRAYNQRYGIDIATDFLSWAGHEVVLASLPGKSDKDNFIVAMHAKDVTKGLLSLGAMEKKVNDRERTNSYVLKHKDYSIRRLGLPALFQDLMGEPFPDLKDCYYVALQDYIVFSENALELVEVIDHYYSRRTLNDNANYHAFADNISDRSNIYIYANLKADVQKLKKYLEGAQAEKAADMLGKFEAMALQFSYFNKMFYTNMFVSYNPDFQDVTVSNWDVALEGNLAGKPHLVKNHRNGKMNMVAFDDKKNMYLIDHVGRIQWQLPLIEAPKDQLFLIDYYNNEKYQYLFNTTNYVYLVDLNGNYVAEYPQKLAAPSSNSLSAFDYEARGNYRLILALDDNKVYNFTKELIPVKGWNKVHASAKIDQPIQHMAKGGKDYLFISDINGNLRITDRKGAERIKPGSNINKAMHSEFYINRTNNKGVFLTTDRKGKVVYIDEKGKVKRTDFGKFTEGHYFFYEDFDQDDHLDFIYIDENRMVVYNRFKKVIAEQHFEEKILHQPVLFNWSGRCYIGVIYDVAGEIRIFDQQGRRFQDHHIEGNVPFEIGSFENGNLNLITGKGKNIMNYQLN